MTDIRRSLIEGTVTAVDQDDHTIVYEGWTYGGVPAEHWHRMEPGLHILVETIQGSRVVAMAIVGGEPGALTEEWLWRKSDADIEAENAATHEKWVETKRKRLDEHREEWERREAALPEPLRNRLARFRANGGEEFDLGGWGYELVICELVAIYQETKGIDDDRVTKIAEEQGTSGNQHECAVFLARMLDEGYHDFANIPAGMTPVTGDADYSKAGAR